VAQAGILPSAGYTSEALWAFERDAVFSHEWLCVGHVNEVPNAGDHLPLTIQGEPLLLVRDKKGVVRVLSGVCQHRGHPMVGGLTEHPMDAPALNAPMLVCPYHNWTYGLDGALVGAPDMRQTCPLPELRSRIRLPEIRSEIFHGLVFVNFDDAATPLGPRLAKLDAEMQTMPLADLVPAQQHSQRGLKWNWKLHHENALEPYHTSFVHKNYHDAVPSSLTVFSAFEDGDCAIMRHTGFAGGEGGDLFEEGGVRRLPDMVGLTTEQRHRVTFVAVMPNLVMVIQPSLITITILNPTGPGTVDTRRLNLYPKEVIENADYRAFADEQFSRIKIIVGQDAATQIALQQAYTSRHVPKGTLAWLESSIPQLNQWVLNAYQRAINKADADSTDKITEQQSCLTK
jgi:phenylpropionate dioxygenase-like ring-hydroxylating dioxygenase large terminal subunit